MTIAMELYTQEVGCKPQLSRSNIDIMELHEIIDKAENEISKKLNITLISHMGPVNMDDNEG